MTRGRCNHATSLHSKKGIREIVRADEENDSAPQSVVERRRQGTQSAFESSNTSREDRQNDEADRRCAQAQSGNSRYWTRPRCLFGGSRDRASIGAFGHGLVEGVFTYGIRQRSARKPRVAVSRQLFLLIQSQSCRSGPREMLRNRRFATPLTPRSCHPLQTVRQLIQPPIAREGRN
jgi:hypothetical protein